MQKVVFRFTSVAQKRCCLSSLLLVQRFIATLTANCERQFQDSWEFLEKENYWLRDREGKWNNCFSKIQLVGQKYREKATLDSKTQERMSYIILSCKTLFSRHCFGFQSRGFSLLVGYNI